MPPDCGFDFTHVSAKTRRFDFPEIIGGGVALLDFDGDGRLDIYCIQSGDLREPGAHGSNRLFRNLGEWRFQDVTESAGVGDTGYGMGAACGDVDQDGDVDLFVTNVGPDVLFLNEGGGRFRRANSGAEGREWSTSAAFFHADDDGRIDLFVTHYVGWDVSAERECRAPFGDRPRDYCPPRSYRAPTKDALFLNRGDGRFEDASASSGIDQAVGNGLGVVAADFDRDGRCDLFVANDGTPNHLWINVGGGRFAERALEATCAYDSLGRAGAGMGVGLVDLTHDGVPALFVTHLRGEMNTLYRNDRTRFVDISTLAGLGGRSRPFTGFGLAFADFDCDRRQDLYVANGRVYLQQPILDPDRPYAEPDSLYRGLDGRRWELVSPAGGTLEPWLASSRAVAAGDLDDDGRVDLVVVAQDEPARILRNVRPRQGHWAILRVLDAHGADATGAEVLVRSASGVQARFLAPSAGYCSSQDPRVHVGLGPDATIEEVTVKHPGGRVAKYGPLEADRVHVLR